MKKVLTVLLLTITIGTSYAASTWECNYSKQNNMLGSIKWTIDRNRITFEDSNYNPANYNDTNTLLTINNKTVEHFFSDALSLKKSFDLNGNNKSLGEHNIKFPDQANSQTYYVNYNIDKQQNGSLDKFTINFQNQVDKRTYLIKTQYVNPYYNDPNADKWFVQETIIDIANHYNVKREQTFKLTNCTKDGKSIVKKT